MYQEYKLLKHFLETDQDDYYNEMLKAVDVRGKDGDYIFLPYALHKR